MNANITYGWLDKDNNKHINNLKGLRENYRISSIDEIIETGLGTCIEQAKLIKYILDRLGLEPKVYCHRVYETSENFDKDVIMHCFVLYKQNGNWYYFEHSNPDTRGIHKFNTLEEAIESATNKKNKSIRTLTEISDFPDGLTFYEFNKYVNEKNADKSVLPNK